jgi:hypothetical protein
MFNFLLDLIELCEEAAQISSARSPSEVDGLKARDGARKTRSQLRKRFALEPGVLFFQILQRRTCRDVEDAKRTMTRDSDKPLIRNAGPEVSFRKLPANNGEARPYVH